MLNVIIAFVLVLLGMLLNQYYNWIGWKKYYEGRKDAQRWESKPR